MDFTLSPNDTLAVQRQFIIDTLAQNVNTAIPAVIVQFDHALQRASVRPVLDLTGTTPQGSRYSIERPVIANVPVWFPYCSMNGFSMTYPVSAGDYCLLVFSQTSFRKWLEGSGANTTPDGSAIPRVFSYDDAIALVGLIPKGTAIPSFSQDHIEIRNRNRFNRISLNDDEINVHTQTAEQEENGVVSDIVFDGNSIEHKVVNAPEEAEVHVKLNDDGTLSTTSTSDTSIQSDTNISQTAGNDIGQTAGNDINQAATNNVVSSAGNAFTASGATSATVMGSNSSIELVKDNANVNAQKTNISGVLNAETYAAGGEPGVTGVAGPTSVVRFVGGLAVEIS